MNSTIFLKFCDGFSVDTYSLRNRLAVVSHLDALSIPGFLSWARRNLKNFESEAFSNVTAGKILQYYLAMWVCGHLSRICVGLFERTRRLRNKRFAANERYRVPPELLFFRFANFTIGAEREVIITQNHTFLLFPIRNRKKVLTSNL